MPNIRAESSDLSNVRPAEYRADRVLFLECASRKVLGIIVEIQLGHDADKPYTWPAYVASLRARHRCPVCLLVVTYKYAVARWAERSIELGPGTRCRPWVIGPKNMPTVSEAEHARKNVELAVLSAVEHIQDLDSPLNENIISAGVQALRGLDVEVSKLYLDLVWLFIEKSARKELKPLMNSLGFEYQSEFARHYVDQGKAEGRVEGEAKGRVELILKQLALRFGPPGESAQTHVLNATDVQLDAIAERVLTAQTLEEALGPSLTAA
jgi:hypothetical protein